MRGRNSYRRRLAALANVLAGRDKGSDNANGKPSSARSRSASGFARRRPLSPLRGESLTPPSHLRFEKGVRDRGRRRAKRRVGGGQVERQRRVSRRGEVVQTWIEVVGLIDLGVSELSGWCVLLRGAG
jgi:hypothetical protein